MFPEGFLEHSTRHTVIRLLTTKLQLSLYFINLIGLSSLSISSYTTLAHAIIYKYELKINNVVFLLKFRFLLKQIEPHPFCLSATANWPLPR